MVKVAKSTKLYLLFFSSGFVNLFLQIVWERQLTLVFGGTIYSITIILASWMGGIALGSYLAAVLRKKFSNLYTVFCYFQLAVLFFALVFPVILSALNIIDKGLFVVMQNSFGLSLLIKGIFIFFSLLIPTTLIGASFPLIAEVVEKPKISYMYSISALGSALGAFFAGFVLIPYLGVVLSMIIVTMVFITIFVFGIAFSVEYKLSNSGRGFTKDNVTESIDIYDKPNIGKNLQATLIILIPLLFLVSGFTALAYEVLYNRVLIYFTGNSSYCFTIIVTTFILGIALGSFVFYLLRKIRLSFSAKFVLFGILEFVIGIWHIFLPLYSDKVNLLSVSIKSFLSSLPIFSVFFTRIFTSALLILPPIAIFGFLFPLVIDLFLQLLPKETAKRVGLLYSSNTIGSVIGALVTGTILVKFFQISSSMRIVAKMNIVISIMIVLVFLVIVFKNKMTFSLSLLMAIICFSSIAIFARQIPSDFSVSKKAALNTKFDKLVYYKEGSFGTVSIAKKWDGTLNLKINGVGEVPTDYNSIRTFRLLGYLPFVIKKNPKSALTIAFGGGITFGSICQVKSLDYKKDIEICKGVIEAADQFYGEWNHGVTKTNKNDIIIGDGRRFVKNTPKRFDLIISDSTHPASFDSWVLYTKEFYTECRNKLKLGGIMTQWLPIHNLSVYDYKTILKTFSSVFNEVNLFFCEEYTIMVGSDKKITLYKNGLNNLLANKTIQEDLKQANLSTFKNIANTKIFNTKLFIEFCKNSPIATDSLSPLQFAETRRFGKDTRITVTGAIYDFLKKNGLHNYSTITLRTHNLFYQKKYMDSIFYLDEKIPVLKQTGEFDEEVGSLFNRLKKKISIEFAKPTVIKYYLNNFSMKNLSKLEKLNTILGNDHNILLLIAKYYYHIGNNKKTLQIFYKMNNLYHDPDTYKNLIIHLQRLNKSDEAKKYLKEAKRKFGEKWGGGITVK